MQTINFQCGHCGKVMGVTANMLGQQVRCPHCKQVVVAPPPAPVEPAVPASTRPGSSPEISFQMPAPREEDSIFAPPESSDALFQESPRLPSMEVPPPPPPPPASPPETWPNMQIEAVAPTPPEVESPGAESEVPAPAHAGGNFEAEVSASQLANDPPSTWSDPGGSLLAPPTAMEETPASIRRAAARSGGNLFLLVVLIFLVPYAVVTTAGVIYLYHLLKSIPHPLEMLQDFPTEHPGATRKGGPSSRTYERRNPDEKLPKHLHVALGGTVQIGALEVAPLKLERKPVVFKFEKTERQPEASPNEALVLTLRLTNISDDQFFVPTDPAFVPKWKEGRDVPMLKPYTMLEVGKKKFYGGPCKWEPQASRPAGWRDKDPQESIEGQNFQVLKPGETMETVVATDPYDADVLRTVDGFQGPLVWRVQLRRGLVKVKSGEVSATAVIGVDIKHMEVPKS